MPHWRTGWSVLGLLLMLAVLASALLPVTRQLTAMAISLTPEGDKLLHVAAFAGLMLWWGNVYRRTGVRLGVAAACLAFGVLIECAQWPADPDDASAWDVLADLVGLGLGVLLLRTPLADMLVRAEDWLGLRQTR
ncbi:VanZ family protein [Frateuria sp. STR12]|uniref:VanZ family protein n=1 Tax=Frateuria hangzhouensis TaxID=2995589 RepID=UPI002261018A|nr:VanZ family protein [Frateuria sp. STR12]MCX7512723.1 VanZ family protein [Frateuria sp. STR12]